MLHKYHSFYVGPVDRFDRVTKCLPQLKDGVIFPLPFMYS